MKNLMCKIKDMASLIYYKESNKYAIQNLNESKEILNELKVKLSQKGSVN